MTARLSPEPRNRITVTIEPALRQQIIDMARAEKRDLSKQVGYLLERAIACRATDQAGR